MAYLEAEANRDLGRTLALATPDMCGFGTGPDEIVLDLEQVRVILARQFSEATQATLQETQILKCVPLPPDACLIMALLVYAVELDGVLETLRPRFSFVMRRDEGRWRVLHLHASVPWSVQKEGESYPLKDIEDRNRKLEWLVAERTSELNRTLELLQRLATTDKLTGIHNRAKLDELIADEHRYLQRHPRSSSIAILDVDHFKDINDCHGHMIGDRVLQEVAFVLGDCVREVDRVGRWGGEEFIILIPDATAAGTRVVAERIQEKLREHDFSVSKPVTVSVGIAQYRLGESVDSWISRADEMLYQAKNSGRNRILLDR
jgi:diguanylate cyclase (GGDEF)-like protein